MPETIRFGIFGTSKVVRDDEGFIVLNVVVQESGLYAGIPPEEVRIVEICPTWATDKEIDEIIKERNQKTDLPYYRRKAKIQILKSATPTK